LTDEEGKRVAIYTRVSTEDQAKEGFSLANQLARLKAYAEARDWTLAKKYVDDGHSGRSTNRPAYQRMMQQKDEWDVLLVLKMDRIHRNSKNFMEMMEDLNEWGKEFASMSESLDTSTAMGRFVMDIIQRIAQLESEQIGERVYWGMSQKAKDGAGRLGFQPPYGYAFQDGRFVIVPQEAEIVERIYEQFLGGTSMHAIADGLQEDDVPTKHGGKWARQTIAKILTNPVYCGYLRWEDQVYPGDHEAILDPRTFNEVQKRRTKDEEKALRLPLRRPVQEAATRGSG
jgi:site-specific DNA recombinase